MYVCVRMHLEYNLFHTSVTCNNKFQQILKIKTWSNCLYVDRISLTCPLCSEPHFVNMCVPLSQFITSFLPCACRTAFQQPVKAAFIHSDALWQMSLWTSLSPTARNKKIKTASPWIFFSSDSKWKGTFVDSDADLISQKHSQMLWFMTAGKGREVSLSLKQIHACLGEVNTSLNTA